MLHETGLTPRLLRAGEFRDLPRYGIGLTDVAKFASGSDSSLARADFDPAAVIEKVERYAPGILAFVGKRAAREVLGGAGRLRAAGGRDRRQRRLGRAVDVRCCARGLGTSQPWQRPWPVQQPRP